MAAMMVHILHGTLFTDEAQFTWDDVTNTRIRTLRHTKIHKVEECHFPHRFSVTMFCGVLASNLTGAYVIEGCLTAPYNTNFLENELLLHFEDVHLPT
jgi:hypothetical protein